MGFNMCLGMGARLTKKVALDECTTGEIDISDGAGEGFYWNWEVRVGLAKSTPCIGIYYETLALFR